MSEPPTTEREHRATVRRLARRSARAAQRTAAAIEDRDAAIVAARAAGVRPVDLAADASVSGALVHRILARANVHEDYGQMTLEERQAAEQERVTAGRQADMTRRMEARQAWLAEGLALLGKPSEGTSERVAEMNRRIAELDAEKAAEDPS